MPYWTLPVLLFVDDGQGLGKSDNLSDRSANEGDFSRVFDGSPWVRPPFPAPNTSLPLARDLLTHRAAKVFRLDISSGRRELWRTLTPADAAGVAGINVRPTASGEGYVYNYVRTLSDPYLVESVN
jgi:hypothetical protein